MKHMTTSDYLLLVVVQVKDLRPGTHGHNLVVKVVSVQNSIEKSRSDGSKIRIAEALVGDTSGCVILTARNGMYARVSGV